MKKLVHHYFAKAVCVLLFIALLSPFELKAQQTDVKVTDLLFVFKNAIQTATSLNQKLIEKQSSLENEKLVLLKEQQEAELKVAEFMKKQQMLLMKKAENDTYLSELKSQLVVEQRIIESNKAEISVLIRKKRAKEAEYNQCKQDEWIPDFICDGIQVLIRLLFSESEGLDSEINLLTARITGLHERINKLNETVVDTELQTRTVQEQLQNNNNQLAVTIAILERNKSEAAKLNEILQDAKVKIDICRNQIKDFDEEIITKENPKARRLMTLNADLSQIIAELTYALL